jgi:tRNA threonylcarbamoyladenosine biosynthesis protein TsaE
MSSNVLSGEFITQSPEATFEFGKKIGSELKGSEILALHADLGGGKTTLTQGIAAGLGIKSQINSPSFIIMREYDLPDNKFFYHVDLYRLEDKFEEELRNLGIADLWGKPENIFVIEWAQKIPKLLPKNTINIFLETIDENSRKIIIKKL